MSNYLNAMRNYVTFSGRATRSEYWLFILFSLIAVIIGAIIDAGIGTSNAGDIGLFAGLIAAAHIIPNYAVLARRLHDANLSAWFLLIGWIPIVAIIFGLLPSTDGKNKYGEAK